MAGRRLQRRQAVRGSCPVTGGIVYTADPRLLKFAARRRALCVSAARHTLTDFPLKIDTARGFLIRAFHTGHKIIHFFCHLCRHHAARTVRFPVIKRDPEIGTARPALHTGIGVRISKRNYIAHDS